MTRAYLAALVAFSLSGCGLISSDLDDFLLDLPEKRFTVDTASWGIQTTGTFPSLPCSPAGTECQDAVLTANLCDAMSNCIGECIEASSMCQIKVPFSLLQLVNLAVENSEFRTVDSRARVRVNEIFFTVEENTLNIASPPLTVWIGPIDATSPADPSAEYVGDIASIGPGEINKRQIMFSAAGAVTVEDYMTDYVTPFHLMVAGEALLRPGQDIPTGKAVGVISGTLVADKF